METYSRQNPFLAKIKERYSLSGNDLQKETFHLTLDLSGSNIEYKVGDSVAVFPQNPPHLVLQTLKALKMRGDELIEDKRLKKTFAIKEFLTKKVEIASVNKKWLKAVLSKLKEKDVCAFQNTSATISDLEYLLEDKDKLKAYLSQFEIWDFLNQFDVRFTLDELSSLFQPLLPRFYSIASSKHFVGDEVHLTVKAVNYQSNGKDRVGVCSYYLKNVAPLNQPAVPIYIQPTKDFTLPSDPQADIIMIGPGTGVAPYRAFMQERLTKRHQGKNWLFFGEWTKENHYFYRDFWEGLKAKLDFQVDLAFSRDQKERIYVQHKMLEKGKKLFEWIANGAYIYVCGDANNMAKDVENALIKILESCGNFSLEQSKNFIKELRKQKKYLRDVY